MRISISSQQMDEKKNETKLKKASCIVLVVEIFMIFHPIRVSSFLFSAPFLTETFTSRLYALIMRQ